MAKIITTNPKREIIGPTVIRRNEKMSGLNSLAPLGSPTINANPITMISTLMAIKIIFNLERLYFIKFIGFHSNILARCC